MEKIKLSPEIHARNIISRRYLNTDIIDISKEINVETGLIYSPSQISSVAARITQGMCLRAHYARTLSRVPQTILS